MAKSIFELKRRMGECCKVEVIMTNELYNMTKESLANKVLETFNKNNICILNPFVKATYIKRITGI